MVVAQSYIDEDQGIDREPEDVDELIKGIMTCLDDQAKAFHWCMAVMKKKGLFTKFKGRMKQHCNNIIDFMTKGFMKKKN